MGGPRDGDTIQVPRVGLLQNLYLSAPDAPGVYWRGAGLAPLAAIFLPAPGGQFIGPPEVITPRPELTLCQ